jgi:hypothetical protein
LLESFKLISTRRAAIKVHGKPVFKDTAFLAWKQPSTWAGWNHFAVSAAARVTDASNPFFIWLFARRFRVGCRRTWPWNWGWCRWRAVGIVTGKNDVLIPRGRKRWKRRTRQSDATFVLVALAFTLGRTATRKSTLVFVTFALAFSFARKNRKSRHILIRTGPFDKAVRDFTPVANEQDIATSGRVAR